MSAQLEAVRRDLVERRLWPVVAVLVLVLVAVPVLLLRAPAAESVATAPPPGVDAGAQRVAQRIPTALNGGRKPVRVRAGARKDPFRVPGVGKVRATPAARGTATPVASPPTPAITPERPIAATPASTSPGPSHPSSGAGPTISVPAVAKVRAPAKRYTVLRADVRFGRSLAALVSRDPARLTAYPTSRRPVALFLGVVRGGERAAFAVSQGAVQEHDAQCRPRRRLCTFVLLKPGETVHLRAPGSDLPWTLGLVRIRRHVTTSRTGAEKAWARESKAGRCVLSVFNLYSFGDGQLDPRQDTTKCRYVGAPAASAALPGAR